MLILTLALLLQVGTDILGFLNPLLAIAAPFITQFIKNQLKLEGNGALLLSLVIAVALAIFGAWATGAFVLGSTAFLFTSIFTASTVIYNMIVKNDNVQSVLPASLQK